MKFNIKRTVLLNALSRVSRAVSLKSPLPVLTGIKFDLQTDGLVLTGSDSDISIQTKVTDDIEIIETGSVVLSSKYILEIVRKIASDTISFEILDGALTRIDGGSSQFNLNGTPAFDYPRIDFAKKGTLLQADSAILKRLIEETSFATSENETRPVLQLTCIATDSYRLAQASSPLSEETVFNIIIPKKSLVEISRIIEKDETVDIYVEDKKVLFIIDDYMVLSRLIDGTFPDTSRLISDYYDFEMTVSSTALLGAIDRTTLLSDEAKNLVTLTMNPDRVLMTSNSQEVGSVEEDLPKAFYKGDPLNISFSGKYLSDAIRSINSDKVKLEFSGPMRPFIVKDLEKDDNIQVVLPVRTY
ncbi:DNA polymerase III subunit beta [uncultured Sharpea sp.]|uniref:DNA polymerase III subunit beta n=1 Tax=uncultured Sharpea sp. TaxID=1112738 RepID=UPI00258AA846|nr:DNA polymerase III subunit beta [uncultured Sharpea sp.]